MRSLQRYVVLAIVAASFAAICPSARADETPLAKVLSDWKKRRESMKSIRVVGVGTCTIAKDVFGGTAEAPDADHVHPAKETWLFDFEKGRVRLESARQVFSPKRSRFHPYYSIVAFDGLVTRSLHPRELNSDKDYSPPEKQPEFRDHCSGEFLYAQHHAFLCALGRQGVARTPVEALQGELTAELVKTPPESDKDPMDSLVLKTPLPGFDDRGYRLLWVTPSRDSAIYRVRTFVFDRLAHEMAIEHKKTEFGWLPSGLTMRSYRSDDGLLEEQLEIAFSEVAVNQPLEAAEFILEPAPGMWVLDEATKKKFRHEPK